VLQIAATSTASTTAAVHTFNTFVASIDFTEPTWDLFIIIFFLVASFIYGLSLGRDRIIIILVGIYMALAVINAAPFLHELKPAEFGVDNIFAFRITTFLAVFVILFFMLSRSALMKTIAKSDAPGSWWQVILFSVMHVGLLISITLSFIPTEFHSQLAPLTRQLFIGEETQFYWLIAPIITMALIRDKKDDDE